jgi:hypothetical protein
VCAELFKRKYKVVKADSRVYFRAYPRQKTMPARLVFRGNLIPTLQLLLTFFFQNSRLKYYGTAQSDLTETEYCLSDCRMIFFSSSCALHENGPTVTVLSIPPCTHGRISLWGQDEE